MKTAQLAGISETHSMASITEVLTDLKVLHSQFGLQSDGIGGLLGKKATSISRKTCSTSNMMDKNLHLPRTFQQNQSDR